MKLNLLPFAFLLSAMLSFPPLTHAQDADKETDAALMRAAEAAKKMGMQMPDVKKIMEEDEKEEAKAKAKVQAVVSAPGPVAFPAWTPKVPDFTPAGPLTKKVIDDAPQIVQTGTSPLTPVTLADAWEKFKNDKYSFSRTRSNINGTITQTVTYRDMDDTTQEVTMEAKREPSEKITHVTITSPFPSPKGETRTNNRFQWLGATNEYFVATAQPAPTRKRSAKRKIIGLSKNSLATNITNL